MGQGISIWSRVVVAELNHSRKISQESVHILEPPFYALEDVKVKIKDTSWKRQGQAVEVLLYLDLLFLVEDENGVMQLVSQETVLRDRVSFQEFDSNKDLLEKDKMIGFNGEIKNLSWDLVINDSEVRMAFNFEYRLIATREQVVSLSEQADNEQERKDFSTMLDELRNEVARARQEKNKLQHQVFLYEKDISSLKRGIRKAENRNSLLDKESKQYQEMLAQLQLAIREQESRRHHYERASYPEEDHGYLPLDHLKDSANNSELSLGSRVKRLFLNSI